MLYRIHSIGIRLSVLNLSLLSVIGWEYVGLIQLENLVQLYLRDFIMMVLTALWPVSICSKVYYQYMMCL